MTLSRASVSRAVALVALAAVAVPAGAGTASAQSPSATAAVAGEGKLTVPLGSKGKGLRVTGLKRRAVRPAKLRGSKLVLPVKTLAVASSSRATVDLSGGLKLRAGRRGVKLKAFELKLAGRQARISAKAGKRRFALFAARLPSGRAQLDRAGDTARVTGAKLRLTRKGAAALRRRLGLRSLRAVVLGRLTLNAKGSSEDGGSGTGGAPGGSVVQACTPPNGTPVSGPVGDEPPLLSRPATAVNVTCASILWRPRESWIQYVNSGEGTSVFGGATNGPAEVRPGSDARLVYSFRFPPKSGWYDPASGKAGLYYQGGVGFKYSAHTIDFSAANPEIEVNGAGSRAIFRFEGANVTGSPKREVLVDLTPGTRQMSNGGKTFTYTNMPGSLTADGSSIFAGFYPPGSEFGSVSVSFTTP